MAWVLSVIVISIRLLHTAGVSISPDCECWWVVINSTKLALPFSSFVETSLWQLRRQIIRINYITEK